MNILRWVSRVAMIVGLLVTPFASIDIENAGAQAPLNRGYFTNKPITSERFNVINNGIPGSISSKAQFISFIEGLINAGRGTAERDRNYVGAAYVVQTMRGGTDRSFPSASDMQDWKNRINNPEITIRWGSFSAAINSGRLNFSIPSRDAARYYGDGITYRSLLFYHNGSLVYAVKQICANPLGNLPGPPAPPPPINFNLNPTVNGTPSFGESNSTVNLNPTVNNTGSTTSTSANWRLQRFTVPAGQPLPNGATNGTAPNTHYGYGSTTIAQGDRTFPRGVRSVGERNEVLPDQPVDTRICYALSVRPVSHTSNNWRHSNPFCVTISKSPKLQVTGGDIMAGRGGDGVITTSTITKRLSGSDRTFGSWGEYAVSATGIVTGMASGSGYSGGRVNSTICDVAYLTISNAGDSTCTDVTVFGSYENLPSLPAVSSRFTPTQTAGATVNLSAGSSGAIYEGTGTIRVSASQPIGLNPDGTGRWVVINAPTADVVITSDIRYTTQNLNSVDQIPQIVIIANNISVQPNVTQVDAWLMATGSTGRINTCTQVSSATQLRSTNCTNPLTINGPVAARTIDLRRTAGSGQGAQSGDPAERINLRPEAFFWATSYNADAGRVPTITTKELPPRF